MLPQTVQGAAASPAGAAPALSAGSDGGEGGQVDGNGNGKAADASADSKEPGNGAPGEPSQPAPSRKPEPPTVLSAADACALLPGNPLAGRSRMCRMGDQVIGCLQFKMSKKQVGRAGAGASAGVGGAGWFFLSTGQQEGAPVWVAHRAPRRPRGRLPGPPFA